MKKKILYLHIGTHKTGTTSIQTYFWDNRSAFREHGIDYPEVGLSGNTHADFVNCQKFPRRDAAIKTLIPSFNWDYSPYQLGQTSTRDELFDQLKLYVERSACSKFVMSSECFYEWTEPEKFADGFSAIFDEIYIVVYLRPQIEWIMSTYNQLIKDDYFRYAGSVRELPQFELLAYFKILRQWESAFGKGSVIARPYVSAPNFNVILDFLSVVGAEPVSDDQVDLESVFENRSIPLKYIDMLKEFNSYPVSNKNRNILISLLQKQGNVGARDQAPEAELDVQSIASEIDLDNDNLIKHFFAGKDPWLALENETDQPRSHWVRSLLAKINKATAHN